MGGSFRRHGNQNDDKGDERRIECRVGNGREKFGVAIKDEGKGIHHLIAHEHVPRFDSTADVRVKRWRESSTTHNSGCDSCQHPTPALPTARATLAEVKMLPAQENHPVK